MYKAMHTPLGKYPETVTYTLGKIAGANNSNLPVGDTYENNAYTRYLKKILNIQNEDVFELQDGNTYEEAVNVAIEDCDIPVSYTHLDVYKRQHRRTSKAHFRSRTGNPSSQ